MQFPRTVLLALISAMTASAANPNPFNNPSNFSATGGQAVTLSWNPTTTGTVSLVLRSGASSDLAAGTVIASNIQNNGNFVWTPSNSLTRGSDYTIEIVDDSDPSQTNYTPYFVLDTTNTVATNTPSVTIGAPTSSLKMSTASPSTASSVTSTSDASSSSTDTSSKKSTVVLSGTRMTTATSGASSMTSGMSSSGMSSSATSSTSMAASSSTSPSSTSSTGAGVRPTIVAGMLGVVALGAFAL